MNEKDEGVRVMVRALRFCREYMSSHNNELFDKNCLCSTCKKVRELYNDIGGNDNFYILKEKYFNITDELK